MLFRWIAIIVLFCCGVSFGAAAPLIQSKQTYGRTIVPVGNKSAHIRKPRHPKDVYSEFTRLDPRDCERYPSSRYPECAELETGGTHIGTDRYFTDPETDRVPIRQSTPPRKSQRQSVPVRRSASRSEVPPYDPEEQDERHLRGMTAQLLITTFKGAVPPEAGLVKVLRQLRKGEIGGVIIREENVSNMNQLRNLSELFISESRHAPLILIERPGAKISWSQPKPGFNSYPAPREIGNKGDALEAFSTYQRMARELAESGVSMNIGPIVDICRKGAPGLGDLCYGDKAAHAAAFASAFIFAHNEEHVLSAMRFRPTGASFSSVEMLNLVMNRMEPDALFIDLDATHGAVTNKIADAQKALRQSGFGGVILHMRSDILTPAQTAEALIATLNSGGDMLLFTPSDDWSLSPVMDNLDLSLSNRIIKRSRIHDAFQHVYRMDRQFRQWREKNSGSSADAGLSPYRRPVY